MIVGGVVSINCTVKEQVPFRPIASVATHETVDLVFPGTISKVKLLLVELAGAGLAVQTTLGSMPELSVASGHEINLWY